MHSLLTGAGAALALFARSRRGTSVAETLVVLGIALLVVVPVVLTVVNLVNAKGSAACSSLNTGVPGGTGTC